MMATETWHFVSCPDPLAGVQPWLPSPALRLVSQRAPDHLPPRSLAFLAIPLWDTEHWLPPTVPEMASLIQRAFSAVADGGIHPGCFCYQPRFC